MKNNSSDTLSKKFVAVLLLALTLVAATFITLTIINAQDKAMEINSFQACADAGYPIQESYPEMCAVPGGRSFTNT